MKEVSILKVQKFVFFPANVLGGRLEKIVLVLDTFFPSRVLLYKEHKYPGMWYYKKYFEKENLDGHMVRKTVSPSSFINQDIMTSGQILWKGLISNNLWDLLSEAHDESFPADRKYKYEGNYSARGITVHEPSEVDDIFS